jgi:tRNA(fMet)-specific endonuclease VapC
MSYRYLLDTNIVSDMVRRPNGLVAKRTAQVGDSLVCTSIVVACELKFGVERVGSERLHQQLERIIGAFAVLPLDDPVAHYYARIRTHLERAGTPIGPNDLLIAAHTLALDLTLVTDNEREFSRVPGLAVENWLTQ